MLAFTLSYEFIPYSDITCTHISQSVRMILSTYQHSSSALLTITFKSVIHNAYPVHMYVIICRA